MSEAKRSLSFKGKDPDNEVVVAELVSLQEKMRDFSIASNH